MFAFWIIYPDNESGVNGLVKFVQEGNICKIKAILKGLKKGKHGFHIHEFGNLTDGCTSAGPHFNPLKK